MIRFLTVLLITAFFAGCTTSPENDPQYSENDLLRQFSGSKIALEGAPINWVTIDLEENDNRSIQASSTVEWHGRPPYPLNDLPVQVSNNQPEDETNLMGLVVFAENDGLDLLFEHRTYCIQPTPEETNILVSDPANAGVQVSVGTVTGTGGSCSVKFTLTEFLFKDLDGQKIHVGQFATNTTTHLQKSTLEVSFLNGGEGTGTGGGFDEPVRMDFLRPSIEAETDQFFFQASNSQRFQLETGNESIVLFDPVMNGRDRALDWSVAAPGSEPRHMTVEQGGESVCQSGCEDNSDLYFASEPGQWEINIESGHCSSQYYCGMPFIVIPSPREP